MDPKTDRSGHGHVTVFIYQTRNSMGNIESIVLDLLNGKTKLITQV